MCHCVAHPSAFSSILFYSTLFYGPRCHQSQEKKKSANFFSHKEVIMQQEKFEETNLQMLFIGQPKLGRWITKNTGVIEKITWKQGTKLKTNQQENNRRNMWQPFSFTEIHVRHLQDEQWSHKDQINQDKEQQLNNTVNLWVMLAMGIYNMITKEQSKIMEWVTVVECGLLRLHLFPVNSK